MKKLILFICCLQIIAVFAQQKNSNCVSKAAMELLRLKIKATKERLVREGRMPVAESVQRPTAFNHAFIWPLVAAPNYRHKPGFYYISNYVDLDPNSSAGDTSTLEDYNCGYRTYDSAPDENGNTYDHTGIDIGIGPFGWKMMDDENVHVVAAEGGTIVSKQTGEASRSCKADGRANTYYGNYIAVEHSDGVVTYYLHMKNGTLTSKGEGDNVVTGEYLGVVGSSGNSTGPHLHFQVESPNGGILDPFQNGPCHDNYVGLVTSSLWANEEPYYNRKILSVFTLSAPWTNASCDETGVSNGISEVVPYSNHFSPNSILYFSAAVRDATSALYPVRFRVIDPDGVELYDNSFTYSGYQSLRTIGPLSLLLGNKTGTYRLLCTYNGVTEPHYFTVGCSLTQTLSGNRGSNSAAISGNAIISTETVLSTAVNTEYQAETYIQLNDGFTATAGCDFTAKIDACTTGGLRTVKDNSRTAATSSRKKLRKK